ncbi:MAG TPA: class I SAM-dependent methyltransferase [Candidatus Saccharimonadales bacterium]|nr:class I SAM-dependent methyltransferase [Candidatus Saccharimonadales bacterium]
MAKQKTASAHRRADQYNDPSHNYRQYWKGREYEHAAEEVALRKMLKGHHFGRAVDIGGGFGRLCPLLAEYADEVVLAEPSQQQLDLATDFLRDYPKVKRELMQADDLQFKPGSVDLITMIRVMHHLPDPKAEFSEVARVLSDEGYAVIEVANYAHFRNRLKHLAKGQRLPVKPVDIRSAANRTEDEIAFVNHNPHTVIRQLQHAGLEVVSTLSVSNLRSPGLKKLVPRGAMLGVERVVQRPLAPLFFGPSVFFLVRKTRKN